MKYKAILPILGFEDEKEYELSHIEGPFYKLEGKNAAFTLIDPSFLRYDYDFEIDDEIARQLKLQEDNVMVLNILTPNNPFDKSTINFAAPLIFNTRDKIFGQVVLDKYDYPLAKEIGEFLGERDAN